MLADVGSVISESGIDTNMGVARWNRIANTFRSTAISTSGFHFRFRGRHFVFPIWPMSAMSAVPYLGTDENVGVVVGIHSPALSAQIVFPLPVFTSSFHFWFSGRYRTMSTISILGRAWSQM